MSIILRRQLSLEKTNLENSFEAESRMKSRMTQQVEELQWKIKNKVEPPTKLVTTQAVIERPNSLMTTSNGNHGIRSKDWSRNGNANANASFKLVCNCSHGSCKFVYITWYIFAGNTPPKMVALL